MCIIEQSLVAFIRSKVQRNDLIVSSPCWYKNHQINGKGACLFILGIVTGIIVVQLVSKGKTRVGQVYRSCDSSPPRKNSGSI